MKNIYHFYFMKVTNRFQQTLVLIFVYSSRTVVFHGQQNGRGCTVKTGVLIYTPKVCNKTHHGV